MRAKACVKTKAKIEGQIPLPARGEQHTSEKPQGFLGRMVAVELLVFENATNTPDARELARSGGGVHEVAVEGVSGGAAPARPDLKVS